MQFIGKKRVGYLATLAKRHEASVCTGMKVGAGAAAGGAVTALFTSSSIPEVVCVAGLALVGASKAIKALGNKRCEHNRRLVDCKKCLEAD